MAFLGGYSDDFELDDDGILRDSGELDGHWTDLIIETKTPGGILIDDEGIVRDDFDLLSKHGSSTHWTDSGLGGDKQSSTPSTLRQLDLQSYPSYDDIHDFDESNVNISDLEASKDDLSFDGDYDREHGIFGEAEVPEVQIKGGNRSELSSRSSFDHSLNFGEPYSQDKDKSGNQDLFGEEYYRQLQELGVLVDEDEFIHPRSSLQEYETIESQYSSHDFTDDGVGFLRHDTVTPTRDSLDIDMPNDVSHDYDVSHDSRNFGNQSHDTTDNDGFQLENEPKIRTRPNTASSTRTISSRSFPEISPEEALELYSERVQLTDNDASSIDFEHSQKTAENDDDEIYFLESQSQSQASDGDQPKPAKMPAYDNENVPSLTLKSKPPRREGGRSVTPQNQLRRAVSHDDSRSSGSRSVTPQPENGYISPSDKFDSFTQVTQYTDSNTRTPSTGDSYRPDSALSETSSSSSEKLPLRPTARKAQKTSLPHARSEESFFNMTDEGSPKRPEKGPKRLLPKPSQGEVSQSFKIKSKSTTNIAALGPVKPTHMSLSEIQAHGLENLEHLDHSDPKSVSSDVPKGELSKKLKQESSKRQQATQLVQQLQYDYDKLLSKYALAELTIDQMRLGAKITLHTNSPTPSQATSGSLQSAQQLQLLQLVTAQRAIPTASPMQGSNNSVFFPENLGQDGGDVRSLSNAGVGPSPALPLITRSESTNSMDSTSTPRGDVEPPGGTTAATEAEKVKLGLMFNATTLGERMESFNTLLGENQLSLDEQEQVFDKIRADHEKLRRDYLQSKEDYNVLKRSSAAGSEVNFDQEKELEGELFKIGMKFDEIHETVDDNMKEKSSQRQPFQTPRREGPDSDSESSEEYPQIENIKKKMKGTRAGDDMLEPKINPEFDKKLKHLHDEYNALMDRYRRLKQMAKSPDRDKEIDNLVKKLTQICGEEPDVFRLPRDLQDRADKILAKEKAKLAAKTGSQAIAMPPGSPVKPKTPGRKSATDKPHKVLPAVPAKSYEILTTSESWSLAESMDRWEQTKEQHRGRPASPGRRPHSGGAHRDGAHRDGDSSINSSRDSLYQDGYKADRSTNAGRDEHDSHLSAHNRSGSYNSLSSRGRHSPRSRDGSSPVPNMPRPRRHDFPDKERRERKSTGDLRKPLDPLAWSITSMTTDSGIASISPGDDLKRSEGGSMTSLPDSGISEQEGGASGLTTGPDSPLSKIPGPGKFKQMTGRREHDTDSGFIGSMVGSEVSAGNLSTGRGQQPTQQSLRLRHPSDVPGNQRPSSRQSSRSDGSTSVRAGTPTSVTSSRSSRRTPTKAFPIKESKHSEARGDVRTPVKSKGEATHSKSKGDRSRSRNLSFTDDSYTTVTESEMSFDSEARQKPKPRIHNDSLRQIDKIEEDSEEGQYSLDPTLNETTDISLSWITSSSERPSTKRVVPKKTTTTSTTTSTKVVRQPARRQGQGRMSRSVTEDDTTPTASPTRVSVRDTTDTTQDTTQDTYTSDETTPRSVIERERKAQKQAATAQAGNRAPSPVELEVKRPQAPGMIQRSRAQVERSRPDHYQNMAFAERQELKAPQREGQKYEDKAIGSGSEETILASDAETAATTGSKGSANSHRIKLLSDEIGMLRQEFQRAHQLQQQQQPLPPPPPPPPPQPAQQPNDYYDQYFDPTDDPLAFMRGPRRRANSFSGHGDDIFRRDWGYDWTLPNVHTDADIPLGYAAADAFASPRQRQLRQQQQQQQQQQNDENLDPSRSRGRQRLRRRIKQRNAGTQHLPEQNGYDSDQSPTRQAEQPTTSPTAAQAVQGHYGYYSPRPLQPLQQQQQETPSPTQHAFPSALQSGRRIYGSQPNLFYSGYQPPPQRSASPTTVSTKSSPRQSSPTRPLRQTLYSYAANPHQYRQNANVQSQDQRPYANDDILVNDGQEAFVPNMRHGATDMISEGGVSNDYAVYTSSCPLCGSASYHTHGEYVYPPADNSPVGFLVNSGRAKVPVIATPKPCPLPLRPSLLPFMGPNLTPHHLHTNRSAYANNQFQPHANHRVSPLVATEPLHAMSSTYTINPPALSNPPIVDDITAMLLNQPIINEYANTNPPIVDEINLKLSEIEAKLNNMKSRQNAEQNRPTTQPVVHVIATAPITPHANSEPTTSDTETVANTKQVRQHNTTQPTHTNHSKPPTKPRLYLVEKQKDSESSGGVRPSRSRSKSANRAMRHYSPDGKIASRYFVRQFGGASESDSTDSDVEIRRRSRSVGRRRRMRHGRKYKRVREDGYYSERGPASRGLPEPTTPEPTEAVKPPDEGEATDTPVTLARRHSFATIRSAQADADLNQSLNLVNEIDELTKKMMNTVGDELQKTRKMKDYGSSVW